MKLKDINTEMSKDKLRKLLECIDECGDEMLRIEVSEIMLDGHLSEESAMHKIKMMEPVVLMVDGKKWTSHKEHPMCDYLDTIGIKDTKALEHVQRAYEKARQHGSEIGINAPPLPDKLTAWDCLWCMAMIFADYWISVGEDIDKASMMAYEYLSDPDKQW